MIKIDEVWFEPATSEEKMRKRGIIYIITNHYDGKKYVGKSKNPFNKRYSGSKWESRTTNILLKRVLNLGKPEDFVVYIIESDIPEKDLNDRERHYAEKLNTYCPNGYNIRECGEGYQYFGKEFKEKSEKSLDRRKKEYKIRHIESGELFVIKDLRKWIKDRGLKEMAMRNLLCEIVDSSQGYCRENFNKNDFENKRASSGKLFFVKNIKSKEWITFQNIKLFTEKMGLEVGSFKCMIRGDSPISQGFCLPETKIKRPTFIVQHEDGRILELTRGEVFLFSKKESLPLDKCHKLFTGTLPFLEKWKFIQKSFLET